MITTIQLTAILILFFLSAFFNGAGDGLKQRRFQTNRIGILYHVYWVLFIMFVLMAGIFYPKVDRLLSLGALAIFGELLLIYSMIRFFVFSPTRNIFKSTPEEPVHYLYIGGTAWSDKLLTKLFGWNNFMKSALFGLRWVSLAGSVALAKYFFL